MNGGLGGHIVPIYVRVPRHRQHAGGLSRECGRNYETPHETALRVALATTKAGICGDGRFTFSGSKQIRLTQIRIAFSA